MTYVDMLLGKNPDGEIKKHSENEDVVALLLLFCGYYNRYITDVTLKDLKDSHGLKRILKPDFLWVEDKKIIEVDGLFTHYPESHFPDPNTIIRYGSTPASEKSALWRGKSHIGNYIKVGQRQKQDKEKLLTYLTNGFSVLKICESELGFLYLNGGAARLLNAESDSEILEIFQNFKDNKQLKRIINKIKWFTES